MKSYREGIADAIMGREYQNPYTLMNPVKMHSYFTGYMDGKEKRRAITEAA